jgi:hypothetical protein
MGIMPNTFVQNTKWTLLDLRYRKKQTRGMLTF